MRLLRLLGLVVLSVSLLVPHGPAAALAGHGHGHHDAGHATAAPCDERAHAALHGTADPCDAHAALHGTACWGACCLAGPAGAILVRGVQIETLAWHTDEDAPGSRSHALDPPPPRAVA